MDSTVIDIMYCMFVAIIVLLVDSIVLFNTDCNISLSIVLFRIC